MSDQVTSLLMRFGLAIILLGGAIGIMYMLAVAEIPEANKETVWTLTGTWMTVTVTAVNWFFASSKGSADKTEAIKRANPVN